MAARLIHSVTHALATLWIQSWSETVSPPLQGTDVGEDGDVDVFAIRFDSPLPTEGEPFFSPYRGPTPMEDKHDDSHSDLGESLDGSRPSTADVSNED
jgi:hypothetical protein